MPRKIILQDFVHTKHDHDSCIDDALKKAETICADRNERLTDLRKTVLRLVWDNHKPVKAYDLLQQLAKVHNRPAPPTVYRALDFLQEAGLVHKIESLNAYVGCSEPHRNHQGQFLICTKCGLIAELDDGELTSRIETNARRVGFKVKAETVEVQGLCSSCQ